MENKVQDAVVGICVDEKIQSDVENLKSKSTILKSDISNLKAGKEYATDMLLQHQKYIESCEEGVKYHNYWRSRK